MLVCFSPPTSQIVFIVHAWPGHPFPLVQQDKLIFEDGLPKFLYFFRQTLVPISKSFFNRLDSVVSLFLWLDGLPYCFILPYAFLLIVEVWCSSNSCGIIGQQYWLRRDGGFLSLEKSGWINKLGPHPPM